MGGDKPGAGARYGGVEGRGQVGRPQPGPHSYLLVVPDTGRGPAGAAATQPATNTGRVKAKGEDSGQTTKLISNSFNNLDELYLLIYQTPPVSPLCLSTWVCFPRKVVDLER